MIILSLKKYLYDIRIDAKPVWLNDGLALFGTFGAYQFEALIEDYPSGDSNRCVSYLRIFEEDETADVACFEGKWVVKPRCRRDRVYAKVLTERLEAMPRLKWEDAYSGRCQSCMRKNKSKVKKTRFPQNKH